MNNDTILIERQLFPVTSRVFLHVNGVESAEVQRRAQHQMVATIADFELAMEEGILCYASVPWEPEFVTQQCLDLVLAAGIRIDHARIVGTNCVGIARRGQITARYEVAPNILLSYSETYTGAPRRLFTFRAVAWTLATMLGAWTAMSDDERNWLLAQGAVLRDERVAVIEKNAAEALELERKASIYTYDRVPKPQKKKVVNNDLPALLR